MLNANTFLNEEDFNHIIKDQVELNAVLLANKGASLQYTDQQFGTKVDAATYAEWAEFLVEIEPIWKWYKVDPPPVDIAKAVYEAVDVVKFQVSRIIRSATYQEWQTGMFNGELKPSVHDDNASKQETFGLLQVYFSRMMNPNNDSIERMHALDMFVFYVCSLFGISKATFIDAMDQKNARCHERVSKGQLQGVDVKSDEQPLGLNTL